MTIPRFTRLFAMHATNATTYVSLAWTKWVERAPSRSYESGRGHSQLALWFELEAVQEWILEDGHELHQAMSVVFAVDTLEDSFLPTGDSGSLVAWVSL